MDLNERGEQGREGGREKCSAADTEGVVAGFPREKNVRKTGK